MPESRQRLTAGERREQIVAVALRHFAETGLHGTSTEDIAAETELSQPYLFRLFRTKRGLFLACLDASNRRILDTFRTAAESAGEGEVLSAMGAAYIDLLADEHLLRFQLQGYAACADPEIRSHVRSGYRTIVEAVRELSGAAEDELWRFFATGMLLNVVATIGLREIAGDDAWAASWMDPKALLDL